MKRFIDRRSSALTESNDPAHVSRWATAAFTFLFFMIALLVDAKGSDEVPSAKAASTKSELVWKGRGQSKRGSAKPIEADRLPGRPIGFKNNRLLFESELFREPLEIDAGWLRSFESNDNSAKANDSSERFAIQLVDGQIFLADIISLDENVLDVESARAGRFEIDRSRIASIVNRETSQTLVSGAIDLDLWDAKRGEKRYWKPNQNGEIVATRDDTHLFFKSELPESCLIDVEIGWDEKLDFSLALQIPYGARSLGSVPRLESWDGSIVFSHDDDFEVVLVELDENSKSLKLLIHWDQKTNTVVIHDEMGIELATATIEKTGKKADPGIFLQNKNGDFRIKSLGIRSAAAGFDPASTSIQLKSDDAINATMESFDGSNWTAIKDGEAVKIAPDEFVGAFQFNPDVKFAPMAGDTFRFLDGEKVIGKLVALDKDSITIESSATTQPIVLKSDRLRQIQFSPGTKLDSNEEFSHVLISDAGKLRGRLESGSPTDDTVLFWRVAGATRAVPFANAVLGEDNVNAKILLERNETKPEIENQWPDTLYLNNRDLLPVRFRSANENEIVVDSFFENRVIPGAKVKAVEFGAKGQIQQLTFSDPGWLKSGKAELRREKFKLKKGGTIGHADLMGRGGFEFELDWPDDKYGILSVQFGRSLKKTGHLESKTGQSFAIMLYGQQYFVTSTSNVQNPGRNIKQRGGKAIRFKVAIEKDQMVIYGDGKECLKKKLREGSGRCVSIRLDDNFGMQSSCEITDLKLSDGFLSVDYIDSKRKELILTIPRLKARNPPGQILCATNFDLARGNIVSMNDDHVMFRSNGSVNRYPRDILGSIVWIDTESLIKSLTSQETNLASADTDTPTNDKRVNASESEQHIEVDKKRQIAQVLMRGGRRVTLTLNRWDKNKLIGESSLLGNCEIPFEQIYEIRMGKFATQATDIPWSDWVAKMAPKPKLDSGGGAGEDDSSVFGGDSPLIGQTPKLTFSMLDGKKLKTESLKGKVVVLDFWATWCGPCVKSLPGIKEVTDSYPDSSVVLLTVNQNESRQKIESFLESRELELKVALDKGDISEKFNVEAIPQTVVIDPAGKIQFVKVGASNDIKTRLRNAIDSLLDTPSE